MRLALISLIALAAAAEAAAQSPPPPPPPPPPIDITGVVVDLVGACNTIRGDNGTDYALRAGVLVPGQVRVGSRVRVVGVVDPAQDCPGRTLIRADGGVTLIGPPPRRPRRGTTVPK